MSGGKEKQLFLLPLQTQFAFSSPLFLDPALFYTPTSYITTYSLQLHNLMNLYDIL